MTLSIPELFMTFSISHDHIIYNYNIHNHFIIDIMPLLCFVIYITIMYDTTSHSIT